MAVFTCPQCGHLQVVDDRHVGKKGTCPKCKTQDVVQALVEAIPDVTPVDVPLQQIIDGISGPLGIWCDGWLDESKHLNKASSLRVGWWTVVDSSMPVQFMEPCGVSVHNIASDYPLSLVYRTRPRIQCHGEAVTAFDVRFMTFDVWGERTNTLQASVIQDLKDGEYATPTLEWALFSETMAEEYCASLSFVSRVRLASGKVRNADLLFVLREAEKIFGGLTEGALEPKSPKKT